MNRELKNVFLKYNITKPPQKIIDSIIKTFEKKETLNDLVTAKKFKSDMKKSLNNLKESEKNRKEKKKLTTMVNRIGKISPEDLFYHLRTKFFFEREKTDNFTNGFEKKYYLFLEELAQISLNLENQHLSKKDYMHFLEQLKDNKKIVFDDFMEDWNRKQVIGVKNGESSDSFLPSIMQDLIEGMFDILVKVESKIVHLDPIAKGELMEEIESLNREMLKKSFIMIQKTQICRTTPKISLTIRCLAGNAQYIGGLKTKKMVIKMIVLNAEGMKNRTEGNPYEHKSRFTVDIEKGLELYDQVTRENIFVKSVVLKLNESFEKKPRNNPIKAGIVKQLANKLAKMTMKNVKNNKETKETVEKKKKKPVKPKTTEHLEATEKKKKITDEVSWLLFKTSFIVNGKPFEVELLSMPVVITSHTNQNGDALANIVWFNCDDCEDDKTNISNGTKPIRWTKLVESIQSAHNVIIGPNTLPLTTAQLNFLKLKVCRVEEKNEIVETFNPDDPKITKNYFCITPLDKEYNFSFFQWFVGTSNFVHDQCSMLWNAGLILGYVTKNKAKELLEDKNSVPGMFLLRFSESQIGAITIVWVDENRAIQNQCPQTSSDIPNSLSLANIICGWDKLKQLYTPNGIIDKVVAFTKHEKKKVTQKAHYNDKLNGSINLNNLENSSTNTTNNKDNDDQFMKNSSLVQASSEQFDEAMDTSEIDSGCNSDSSRDNCDDSSDSSSDSSDSSSDSCDESTRDFELDGIDPSFLKLERGIEGYDYNENENFNPSTFIKPKSCVRN